MSVLQTPGSSRQLMLRSCRWLICAGAGVVLAGCAPVRVEPQSVTPVPEPGRAIVIGFGNTAAENAREALTPEQGHRVSRLFVSFVDGRRIPFGENIVRLPPGEYQLAVSCGIYRYYKFYTDDKFVHVTLDADRVYRLRTDLDGIRCEASLEDITGKGG